MKKEIKDKWVAALRSGEYQQAYGRLRDDNSFCCLGVLCDISGLGKWVNESGSWHYSITGCYKYRRALPGFLCKEFEIASSAAKLKEQVVKKESLGKLAHLVVGNSLSGLNDAGVPFKEIADIIEKDCVA